MRTRNSSWFVQISPCIFLNVSHFLVHRICEPLASSSHPSSQQIPSEHLLSPALGIHSGKAEVDFLSVCPYSHQTWEGNTFSCLPCVLCSASYWEDVVILCFCLILFSHRDFQTPRCDLDTKSVWAPPHQPQTIVSGPSMVFSFKEESCPSSAGVGGLQKALIPLWIMTPKLVNWSWPSTFSSAFHLVRLPAIHADRTTFLKPWPLLCNSPNTSIYWSSLRDLACRGSEWDVGPYS